METALDSLPVSEVSFAPLGSAREGSEVTNVRNATPGLAYHLQGVGVQLACHLQAKELLHFSDFVINRTNVPSSINILHLFCEIVVILQVLLLEQVQFLDHFLGFSAIAY